MFALSSKVRGAAVVAAAALLLTACSAAGSEPGGSAPAAEPAGTITLETGFGTVDVPAAPERALGFYTTDVDILITLGIPLAQMQPIRGDSGYSDFPAFFPQEQLANVTPFANYPEFDYEKVVEADPDFILNSLAYDETIPSKLSPIAPTYSFNGFDGQDWRVHFKHTAEVLGRTAQYQAWTDAYQARADELKAELDAAGVDPLVAPLGLWEGKVGASCYGTICLVLEDLGLRISDLATAEDGVGTELSLEQLDKLKDLDAVFTSIGVDGQDTVLRTSEQLKSSSVWQSLDFVSGDEIHTYEMEMDYGSPSGQMALLESVAKALLP